MCVKLFVGDLNPNPCLPYLTSTYTCRVTNAPRVCGGIPKRTLTIHLLHEKCFLENIFGDFQYIGSVQISFILLKTENNKKIIIIKKLLFTHLALFISLKSLFMDNKQCQTRVQEKKKKMQKMQCKKRNTQTPPQYGKKYKLMDNVFYLINTK